MSTTLMGQVLANLAAAGSTTRPEHVSLLVERAMLEAGFADTHVVAGFASDGRMIAVVYRESGPPPPYWLSLAQSFVRDLLPPWLKLAVIAAAPRAAAASAETATTFAARRAPAVAPCSGPRRFLRRQ